MGAQSLMSGKGMCMRCFDLVIVDDEPILLRGLVETYPWDKMGFRVVGSAQSGEQAMELIEEKLPQVVLTDIRMKQIDGLMVMEEIKSKYPDIEFIFISAHRDFEYARKACEMQAYSFISKPIEEEQLFKVMQGVYGLCRKRAQEEKQRENLNKILMEDNDSFLRMILQKYLLKMLPEEKVQEFFSLLDYRIDEKDHFIALCADIDIFYKITNPIEYEAARYQLVQYMKKNFEEYKTICFENEEGHIIYIVWVKEGENPHLKKRMELARECVSQEVISAISGRGRGFSGLRKCYGEVLELFELANLSGAGALEGSADAGEDKRAENIINQWENMLLSCVRKGDTEQIKEVFIKYIYELPGNLELQKLSLHDLMLKVDFLLTKSCGKSQETSESLKRFYMGLYQLSEAKAVDVCYKLLRDIAGERKRHVEANETEVFRGYMSEAIAYIHEHLSDDKLSVVSVANHIYLNPVYFGRVFKNTYHMTFKQYVIKLRIEKAASIILSGEKNMGKVCEAVGIVSPSYFSQLFKKYMGVLPSEYTKERVSDERKENAEKDLRDTK